MKILVTGAAGFIGSYVCKYLLSRGDEVVGLDNINSYYDINLKYGRLLTLGIEENAVNWYLFVESNVYEKFRFIRMNLEDKQAMQMLFANERFDKVVNLAAQAGVRYSIENPYAYVESNIDGFLNQLKLSRIYSYGWNKILIRISFFARIISITFSKSSRRLIWVMSGFTFSFPSTM